MMTKIKICGITNLDDALVAADAGADLLGFIFYRASPRYIAPERAREIVGEIRRQAPAIRMVGVFVNESIDGVRAAAGQSEIDLAQLHGDETPQMVRALNEEAAAGNLAERPSLHAFKALRPRDLEQAKALMGEYQPPANEAPPAFIVDAFDASRFGGTGLYTDWRIAAQIANRAPVLLAGGLTADNVADAIDAVRPWGVDVSSGVERAPGLKDHAKVKRFIANVKAFGTARA